MPKDNIPEIRVAGFSEVQWSKKKCEDLLTERNVQHPQSEEYPLVSFTIEDGVTPKTERYERESLVAGDKNAKKYKETRLNDIVYNPANLKFGAIARNKYGNAVFSPIYVTFDVNENFAVPEFVEVLVSKKDFIQDALQYQKGTVYERMSVCSTDFLNLDVKIPSVAEQRQIGSIFERLDALISQHQHKHEALVAVKKAMLEKMFPKEGENVPEIRFVGFTDPWEQRKLGEIGEVITGSTPSTQHPEYYSEDGMPWVTPTDIVDNIIYDTPRKLSPIGEKVGRVVPADTILVTCIASIGKNAMLVNTGSFNQQINSLVPDKKKYDPYFLLTESFHWSAKMKREAAAGTMQIVNKNEFSAIETYVPELSEQKAIGAYFCQIDKLITLHQRKCEVLKNLKSALLSKMFV